MPSLHQSRSGFGARKRVENAAGRDERARAESAARGAMRYPVAMRSARPHAIALVWLLGACGSRSTVAPPTPFDAGERREQPELCNGLDDDGDGMIDEDFRDAQGNYTSDAHCGRCGHACDQPLANATAV